MVWGQAGMVRRQGPMCKGLSVTDCLACFAHSFPLGALSGPLFLLALVCHAMPRKTVVESAEWSPKADLADA